jgi:hypothetical protein
LLVDNFQRDRPAQARVASLEDLTHAPGTQQRLDLVRPELRAHDRLSHG